MHILTWNGRESKVMAGDVVYTTYEKPKLSFEYIALFYEEPTGLDFYVDEDSEKKTLTDEQKKEIISWCEDFEDKEDYLVAVVNEDRIFDHMEYKKKADELGLTYIFSEEPDSDYIWRLNDSNQWEQIYAGFTEDGTPHYWPKRGHPYVLFMTQDEYGRLGERPTMAHTLNFTKMEWVDARDLDRLKFHAKSDVMGYFQYYRSHNFEGRISVFEASTWMTQKTEAENYLKDEKANTPFIDGMMEELEGVIDKKELCEKIVKHYSDEKMRETGRLHGKMYKYIYAIEYAQTIAEVDKIIEELTQFTGGKTLINATSEYRPALKQYGEDVIVVEDSRETFYHSKLG